MVLDELATSTVPLVAVHSTYEVPAPSTKPLPVSEMLSLSPHTVAGVAVAPALNLYIVTSLVTSAPQASPVHRNL